eukprot:6410454-Alexandrium_andersonii.AAC.1
MGAASGRASAPRRRGPVAPSEAHRGGAELERAAVRRERSRSAQGPRQRRPRPGRSATAPK